jgi:hypothetical protein
MNWQQNKKSIVFAGIKIPYRSGRSWSTLKNSGFHVVVNSHFTSKKTTWFVEKIILGKDSSVGEGSSNKSILISGRH